MRQASHIGTHSGTSTVDSTVVMLSGYLRDIKVLHPVVKRCFARGLCVVDLMAVCFQAGQPPRGKPVGGE